MKIVVNAIAASGGGGALTLLTSFHRYVSEFGGDHEWVFLLGSGLLEESGNIRTIVLPDVKSSWLRRLRFDLITGRRLLASLKPDVVFSLQNTSTYGLDCPQVVYVHQSLPFQKTKNFSFWRRDERFLAIYQHVIGAIIKQSIRHADHIIVQTQWMRDAILDQVGIGGERITSVLPDLDKLSDYAFGGRLDAGAFSYPTSDQIYKNNGCIYAACKLLREQGVDDFTVTMTVDGPASDPNVASIGRVPREQVLELLSHTTLIFPSLIETYGLPLAEARTLNTIVLAADLPYAREVLNGYANAHYFDPASPNQLAALMKMVINGTIARSRDCHDSAKSQPVETEAWAEVITILSTCANKAVHNNDNPDGSH